MATITGNSSGWGALRSERDRLSNRMLPSQFSQDPQARVAHSRYRQSAVRQELASAREQQLQLPYLTVRSRGPTASKFPDLRSECHHFNPVAGGSVGTCNSDSPGTATTQLLTPLPRERWGPIVSSDNWE